MYGPAAAMRLPQITEESVGLAHPFAVISLQSLLLHSSPLDSLTMDVATVSLDIYLSDPTSEAARTEAVKAAESLITTGALIVRDSRAQKEVNDRFLDLFEDYFAQTEEALKVDERPEQGYQVVRLDKSIVTGALCVLTPLGGYAGEYRKAEMRQR